MSIQRPSQNDHIHLGEYETSESSAIIKVTDADISLVTLTIQGQTFGREDLCELIILLQEFQGILE